MSGAANVDVAVWLGIKGGKDAEREFQNFGRAGKESIREIREAARGLPPHLVAVSRGVSGVREGIEGMASRAGLMSSVAGSFGMAGTAAAAGAVAIGLAAKATYDATRGAMLFADAVADTAASLKVSTDTLQEYRYAVHAAGGEFEDADTAIGEFTKKLGEAEGGAKRSLMWFQKLGFTQQQLKDFKTADEALAAVSDRIAGVGKESQAMAIANKVGLGSMYPLIRQGADEMERLRKEAHDLGFVMDKDVVQRLGDANDKFEAAAHVIGVQFKSAFVDLAPVLVEVMQHLGNMTRQVNDLVGSMQKLENRSRGTLQHQIAEASADIEYAKDHLPPGYRDLVIRHQVGKLGRLNDALARLGPETPDTTGQGVAGGTELSDPDGDAAAAKKAAAERERFLTAMAKARQQLAGEFAAGAELTGAIEDRYAHQQSMLDLEEKERAAELKRMVTAGDLTAAHAAELQRAEEQARDGKRANLRMKERLEVEDQRLAQERALADLNDELLNLAVAGARTAKERRELELQALENRRAIERRQLERELERDANLTEEQRQQRLGGFDRNTEGQRGQVRHNTMGPLEQFRDGLLSSSAEIDEALQGIAVDGLQSLNDGLVEAIMNAGDLGDVFTNVANQIVAGLMRIAIQQAIIKPLADSLGMGGGGGGDGIWSTFANAIGSYLGGGSSGAQLTKDWNSLSTPGMRGGFGFGTPAMPRAGGGPVYRGDLRLVGELGAERLAATSDGYVFDHAATAHQMADTSRRTSDGAAGGGPISVHLNNGSGTPLRATATERQGSDGSRNLDIDLRGFVETVADQRVREMTEGRRDDQALGANFGVHRRLSGS